MTQDSASFTRPRVRFSVQLLGLRLRPAPQGGAGDSGGPGRVRLCRAARDGFRAVLEPVLKLRRRLLAPPSVTGCGC